MTNRLPEAAVYLARWLGGGDDGDGGHGEFGVHIEYSDLYHAVLFLVCIYVGGQLASYVAMPSLVGEIVVGILLGPPLAGFVPNPPAWVLLGEIGLILLVLEAGIDIDVATLKLIGTRGLMIALVGSFLPIAIGIVLALAINGTDDMIAAIAAGATFGPTSLGIALNILRNGGVLNTPIGQLIISAAVIDDMIALIVLSQLQSLTGTITASSVLIPILSALGFLVIGGYIALFIMPFVMEKYLLIRIKPENHGKAAMAVMFGLLVILMPATYYAKASYLMGAFIAGLSFCTNHDVHVQFVRQFKRLLQWLMRIFFAASIGFQVPIKDFFQAHVLWQGAVFTIALLGKLVVGFMVPNFSAYKKFTGIHLRDCLMTGLSMAAEGEFAFVIAVYSVDQGLIDKDMYASVVLAVLLSTIIPPFLLRYTISYYNKKAQETLQNLAKDEMERHYDLEHDASKNDAKPEGSETASDASSVNMRKSRHEKLMEELHAKTAVFLCIQTQSEGRWGLMHQIMATLAELGLEIIDHRSWHPRGIHATLVNEIYAKDSIEIHKKGESNAVLQDRMQAIQEALSNAIQQPETSKVRVQRWFPGVVEEITTETAPEAGRGNEQRTQKTKTNVNLEQRLLSEANAAMDKRQSLHLSATKQKTVEEILAEMKSHIVPVTVKETNDTSSNAVDALVTASAGDGDVVTQKRARRRTHKMRSTPVVGGGLFGETSNEEKSECAGGNGGGAAGHISTGHAGGTGSGDEAKKWSLGSMGPDFGSHGHRAEIIVEGESYTIRIDSSTLKSLQTGISGDMLDSHGVSVMDGGSSGIQPDNANVTSMLQGYVRNAQHMSQIVEDVNDFESETTSIQNGAQPQPVEEMEEVQLDSEKDLPPV